jgi:uncharacterized protein
MWSSYRGYTEIVKLLLKASNINVNLRNRGGYTALMLAKFNNYNRIVQLLKNAGAEEK